MLALYFFGVPAECADIRRCVFRMHRVRLTTPSMIQAPQTDTVLEIYSLQLYFLFQRIDELA